MCSEWRQTCPVIVLPTAYTEIRMHAELQECMCNHRGGCGSFSWTTTGAGMPPFIACPWELPISSNEGCLFICGYLTLSSEPSYQVGEKETGPKVPPNTWCTVPHWGCNPVVPILFRLAAPLIYCTIGRSSPLGLQCIRQWVFCKDFVAPLGATTQLGIHSCNLLHTYLDITPWVNMHEIILQFSQIRRCLIEFLHYVLLKNHSIPVEFWIATTNSLLLLHRIH